MPIYIKAITKPAITNKSLPMFSPAISSQFAKIETPFYYYDIDLLRRSLQSCAEASKKYHFHVHYALKANFNDRVLAEIRSAGFGADCVSSGEVQQAIGAGFDKKQVVFAGVGKSDKEINAALALDIFCFNVESVQEIEIINSLALLQSKKARIAIRINPNVDAHTHAHITTGLDENKFGINQWDLESCVETIRQSSNLEFLGLHFHVGSQITEMNVFKQLCVKVNEYASWFEDKGLRVKVLNVGGGLGIDYRHPNNQIPDFEKYFSIFNEFLEVTPNQEVHFELGRALVGQCAALISRVLYVKHGRSKNFVVLDAGMTELMRPALYQAFHKIENLSEAERTTDSNPDEMLHYDIVGPICESTDCFAKDVEFLPVSRGDVFAIRSTGAYGEVLASRYNLRPEIRQVYSDKI